MVMSKDDLKNTIDSLRSSENKDVKKLLSYIDTVIKGMPEYDLFQMPRTPEEKSAVKAYIKAYEWYESHPDWGNFQIPKEFRLPVGLTSEQQIYLRNNFGQINHLR
jgi:hypothetical protein